MDQSTPHVTLEVITAETLPAILELAVSPSQQAYVADNATSIAEAHYNPGAWYRAIYCDGVPVGFVMLFDTNKPGAFATDPVKPTDMVLWRLMIDHRYQGRGLGRRALDAVKLCIAEMGQFDRLVSSFVPGPDAAEGFYLAYGFTRTGRIWDNGTEPEIALNLR